LIAVDTNILVYAHRSELAEHAPAREAVGRLAEGRVRWAIPWPCVYEFLAVVTHPRIFKPPTPVVRALEQARAWMESPTLVMIGEDEETYFDGFAELLASGGVTGPRIHDARIAALCVHHGVTELWTADRDFSRFAGLRVRNPVVAGTT
jgi:uncharacterized protein